MRSRTLSGLALLALPAILGARFLHTELKESDPAADAVLSEPPTAITLTYTTGVQLALSSVEVRPSTATGASAASAGALRYLADDRRDVLVLPLTGPLAGGSYTVSWTTAGPDGHQLSGDFGFQVAGPAAPEAGDPAGGARAVAGAAVPSAGDARGGDGPRGGAPGGTNGLGPLWSFILYAGIVMLLGGVVFRSLVIGPCARGGASREWTDSATAETSLFLAVPLGFLLVAAIARLWHRTAAFFPDDVAGNLLTVATGGTPWAAGWWLGLVCAVLVAGGLLLRREHRIRPTGWRVIAVCALLLPVVPALSGHGWADSPRAVSVVATCLHVVAAGGWVGGLACLLWVNARLPGQTGQGAAASPDEPGLAGMVSAFSRVAQAAVAVLLLTGALKTWMHIDAASQLWTTPWGRALLVKAAIVAGVLALGFWNWRVVRPRLERGEGGAGPMRAALAELLLGMAAVVATAFLAAQPLN